jgi:hypothetical protein
LVAGNWADGYASSSATGLVWRDNYSPGSNSVGYAAARLPKHLTATASWDCGELIDGASAVKDVTVTGAVVGDVVGVGMDLIEDATPYSGALQLSGRVKTTNTVTVSLTNHTGNTINPNNVTVRCDVWQH